MLPSSDVVTHIHERDSIVEMLFSTLELIGRRTLNMLVAGIEMKGGAVGKFLDGTANDLLKMRLRLIGLVLLHGAQSGFVTLQSLRITRVIRQGLLCGCFLSHV